MLFCSAGSEKESYTIQQNSHRRFIGEGNEREKATREAFGMERKEREREI